MVARFEILDQGGVRITHALQLRALHAECIGDHRIRTAVRDQVVCRDRVALAVAIVYVHPSVVHGLDLNSGMGDPQVGPLPWTIDQPEPWSWNKAATILGVVGGSLGILLTIRALMKSRARRSRRARG